MSFDFGGIKDESFVAGEDLSSYQYRFVKLHTDGTIKLLDSANDEVYGVLQNDPVSGESATVRTLGVTKVEANAAITFGKFVKAEYVSGTDCGKAADAVADKDLIVGVVVDSSGAEDDLVAVELLIGVGAGAPKTKKTVVTTEATADVVTYTAAQILGGLIKRDPAGSARSDVFPTAANIIAALKNAQVGDSFEFLVQNTADASETITMTNGGAGGCTLSGTMTIAQNYSRKFLALVTSSTAVTIYSVGSIAN